MKARRSGRHLEEEAAILIQKQYRAIIGGRVGRLALKRGRREIRDGWRQRRDDDVVRKKLVYRVRDAFKLAPSLASDTVEEQVLRHVWWWNRSRVRRVLALNTSDAAMLPHLIDAHDPKRRLKIGFDVGTSRGLRGKRRPSPSPRPYVTIARTRARTRARARARTVPINIPTNVTL